MGFTRIRKLDRLWQPVPGNQAAGLNGHVLAATYQLGVDFSTPLFIAVKPIDKMMLIEVSNTQGAY
jgi:hypothetical protein